MVLHISRKLLFVIVISLIISLAAIMKFVFCLLVVLPFVSMTPMRRSSIDTGNPFLNAACKFYFIFYIKNKRNNFYKTFFICFH